MSQEPSYWGEAFKPWFTWYKDTDYRIGAIEREHFMDEIDNHDFPIENSVLSHRMGTRLYRSPFEGVKYPRECAKYVSRYYDCRREHGVYSIVDNGPPQCNGKKAEVFDRCPNWVVQNLSAKRKFFKRAELIDRLTYQRAMEVSDYNK